MNNKVTVKVSEL